MIMMMMMLMMMMMNGSGHISYWARPYLGDKLSPLMVYMI